MKKTSAYIEDKASWPGWWPFAEAPRPSDADLEFIRPLTEVAAARCWDCWMGSGRHPMLLSPDTWACRAEWLDVAQLPYSPDDAPMPPAATVAVDWPDDATIYFLAMRETVIEAKWGIFKRHWACFLYVGDEGPFVLSPGHADALQITPHQVLRVARRLPLAHLSKLPIARR